MTGGLSNFQSRMLVMEEKTAAFYLVEGVIALSSLQKSTSFYPAPFNLVANGLERLLKLDLLLGELYRRHMLPRRALLKRLSHDLWTLTDAVLETRTSGSREAKRLVDTDRVLRSLIDALSDFAGDGRYLYLDQLLEPNKAARDPWKAWDRVEREVINTTTTGTGELWTSWLWGHALRGETATFVRRRNEIMLKSLLDFVAALTRHFVEMIPLDEAGYMRIFLSDRPSGKPPTRAQFRSMANSPDLDAWELALESGFSGT